MEIGKIFKFSICDKKNHKVTYWDCALRFYENWKTHAYVCNAYFKMALVYYSILIRKTKFLWLAFLLLIQFLEDLVLKYLHKHCVEHFYESAIDHYPFASVFVQYLAAQVRSFWLLKGVHNLKVYLNYNMKTTLN